MQRVPSHFWAQSDPQNGAHCQAIIVFILTRSVGPTHLSITYCSGCIAHLLLVEEKSELSHILPASRPARLNRNVRFSFRDNLRFPTGSHPYSFFGKMECRFRQTVRRCSVQAGKERNSGYFGRMRSSKIKGRTPFKRCLLPAC